MIGAEQTYMVVSLAFAVFAAITAVGGAIVLSIGFERMRNGFNKVKEMVDVLNRQTGFFSTAIHTMEQRVEALDVRQGTLESQTVSSNERTDSMLRYAETMVTQAKHEIKQEVRAASEATHVRNPVDDQLEDYMKQSSTSPQRESEPVHSGIEALTVGQPYQKSMDVKPSEQQGSSSLYFGANSDHIRFV
tara:strand:- start:672044 stop:672613 length:570 start_codon:yes stop_codon:yes gene_type:complete